MNTTEKFLVIVGLLVGGYLSVLVNIIGLKKRELRENKWNRGLLWISAVMVVFGAFLKVLHIGHLIAEGLLIGGLVLMFVVLFKYLLHYKELQSMDAQSIKMAVLNNKVYYIAYLLWLVVLIYSYFIA